MNPVGRMMHAQITDILNHGVKDAGRRLHEECTSLDDFWDLLPDDQKAGWAEREACVQKPLENILAAWLAACRVRPPYDREAEFSRLAALTERLLIARNHLK